MNRTLTTAAALVASTAGVAGLSGTATADPAPGFPAAPIVHGGVDALTGTLQTAMQPVGQVVPAAQRAVGRSAAGGTDRANVPLVDQIHGASPASLLKGVGELAGKATGSSHATPAQAQQADRPNESSVVGDSSAGSQALPGTGMLNNLTGGGSALGDQSLARSAMIADPVGSVTRLAGDAPVVGSSLGKINALGHD